MAPPRWDTVVFTSEIGFLLHLPHWIDPTYEKLIYVVTRCLLHAIAIPLLLWDALDDPFSWKAAESIFNGSKASAGWLLMGVSLIIYIISYIHHTLFSKKRHIMPALFAVAHLSIINFVLDRPAHKIKTVKFSRPLVKIAQFIIGIIVLFIVVTVVPLQNAWGCYDPAFVHSLQDYSLGTCPTDGTSQHEICTYYPIVKCDTSFQPSILSETIHYASQALAAVFVIYLLETYDEINYHQSFASKKI